MVVRAEAERRLLSDAGDIFLSKAVQVDGHSKKGGSTEPRTLVSVLQFYDVIAECTQ